MKKYEVIADRITLTVCKGSHVMLEDNQAQLAKTFIKPLEKKPVVEVETKVAEEPEEKAVIKKRTKK